METISVATFNVRHCEGLDGNVDPGRTAGILTEMGADVIALQEVDRGVERSGGVDQAAELARLMEMHVEFFPTLTMGDGDYGVALATRAPCRLSTMILPRVHDEEPRAAIWARVGGATMIVTHLSTHAEPRLLQMGALASLAESLPPPVILMGDLNATRRGVGGLLAVGLRPGHRRHLTHHARLPTKQIDWILAGPGARVTSSWTVRTKASDHRPLGATVEVDPTAVKVVNY
jgi:endonuclease/exonuclease/phosphatase family metal-dependent hydrolase